MAITVGALQSNAHASVRYYCNAIISKHCLARRTVAEEKNQKSDNKAAEHPQAAALAATDSSARPPTRVFSAARAASPLPKGRS